MARLAFSAALLAAVAAAEPKVTNKALIQCETFQLSRPSVRERQN